MRGGETLHDVQYLWEKSAPGASRDACPSLVQKCAIKTLGGWEAGASFVDLLIAQPLVIAPALSCVRDSTSPERTELLQDGGRLGARLTSFAVYPGTRLSVLRPPLEKDEVFSAGTRCGHSLGENPRVLPSTRSKDLMCCR
jgi:hypothetical protein